MNARTRSIRTRAAAGALFALLALATGAGAGAALAAHRTVSAAEAAPVATSIALRHADLPRLKLQSNPMTAQEIAQSAQLTSCVGGVPASEALANTQSPNFVSSSGVSETVSSGTEILPSDALVAKDFAAITGPHGLPCLLAQLRSQLVGTPGKGETVTSHASILPPVVSGADSAFADRFVVVLRVTHKNTTLVLPIYVDLIGFVYGQAEVSLSVEVVGAKPTSALEHRLAGLLLARARTAIG